MAVFITRKVAVLCELSKPKPEVIKSGVVVKIITLRTSGPEKIPVQGKKAEVIRCWCRRDPWMETPAEDLYEVRLLGKKKAKPLYFTHKELELS